VVKLRQIDQKINVSCFNEYDALKSVAVCSPAEHAPKSSLECDYQLFLHPVSTELIKQDHEILCNKLKSLGVEVVDLAEYLNGAAKVSSLLANRIFVRDIAAAMAENLVIGKSASVCRYPEFNLSHKGLKEVVVNIKDILNSDDLTCGNESLEFGDLLLLNDDAFLLNYGNRTQTPDAAKLMEQLLKLGFKEGGIISIPMETENIHLDLTCNIVGKDLVLAVEPFRFLPIQVYKANQIPSYMTVPDFFKRHGYEIRYFIPESSPDFLN
jgi:arginine deiminase